MDAIEAITDRIRSLRSRKRRVAFRSTIFIFDEHYEMIIIGNVWLVECCIIKISPIQILVFEYKKNKYIMYEYYTISFDLKMKISHASFEFSVHDVNVL